MTIIESIKDYFKNCNMIESDSTIYADYLPSEVTEYAIYQTGNQEGGIVKSYINGVKLRQFTFVFASRFDYSMINSVENIENSGFYEKLEKWIEDNNKNRIFPVGIDRPQKIEVLQTGAIFMVDPGGKIAEYQMIARLLYKK